MPLAVSAEAGTASGGAGSATGACVGGDSATGAPVGTGPGDTEAGAGSAEGASNAVVCWTTALTDEASAVPPPAPAGGRAGRAATVSPAVTTAAAYLTCGPATSATERRNADDRNPSAPGGPLPPAQHRRSVTPGPRPVAFW